MISRDQWGFQEQCYLQANSLIDPADPWAKYRLPNGEFKFWLHVWSYDKKGERIEPWIPLPWVLDTNPDGDTLLAMYNLGVTARWPTQWPAWSKNIIDPVWNMSAGGGPIYGKIFPNHRPLALDTFLTAMRHRCLTKIDFEVMLETLILFPRRKVNANSRSTKDRAKTV